MTRTLPLTLVALVVGCTQTATRDSRPSTPPAESKPAPAERVEARSGPLAIGADMVMADTEMANVDGRVVTLAGAKGDKGTLVIFTCNHCPYAKAWEARISDVGNAAMKMGFGVVAVNPNDPVSYPEDGPEEMKARSAELGFEFPYVVDATSDVARAFGASKTPEVFLFDADDKLVYYGAVDDNYRDANDVEAHYLQDAIKAVAAGQPVEKKVTKALGCSIKFRQPA